MTRFIISFGLLVMMTCAALSVLAVEAGRVLPGDGQIGYVVLQHDSRARPYMLDVSHEIVLPLDITIDRVLYGQWSPDGQEIAFHMEGSITRILDLETRTSVQLDSDTIGFEWLTNVSQYIFFSSATIYTVNQDGTNFAELPPGLSIYHSHDVSPDMEQIVFVEQNGGEPFGIDVINIDRTGFQQLRLSEDRLSFPLWSPDGHLIAFAESENDIPTQLHVMNADGSNGRHLATFANIRRFAWSPDNRSIAVVGENNMAISLQIVDIDGQSRTLIDNYHGDSVHWSPDGRFIVVMWAENITTPHFDVVALSSGQVLLTEDGTFERWASDSKTVAYIPESGEGICVLSIQRLTERCFAVDGYVMGGGILWLP